MSKLALDGGTPVHNTRSHPWPGWPPRSEERWSQHAAGLREVYFSGNEGLPQTRGQRFATAFCDYLGAAHGFLTTSGTSALKLSLAAVTDTDGLGYNGECIVPSYTFIASAHAAWEMGFSVRFVDVEPESACLCPKALEAAITPKTRVVMPVHILGCPADMDAILAVARKHGLKVVEDACQSHGAGYKGRKVGAIGDAGAFSFQSSKNLNCGEGGFVATASDVVYKRAYALHCVGKAPPGMSLDEPRAGYSYRASEYLAVLLEDRLRELDAQCEQRDRGAAYLIRELNGITGIRPAQVSASVTRHAWHLFPMRYISSAFGGRSRGDFIRALQAEGIPCSTGYAELLSRHSVTQAVRSRHPELVAEEPCPNTQRICDESVWLYQSILLAEERELASIPEAIRKIQKAFHA